MREAPRTSINLISTLGVYQLLYLTVIDSIPRHSFVLVFGSFMLMSVKFVVKNPWLPFTEVPSIKDSEPLSEENSIIFLVISSPSPVIPQSYRFPLITRRFTENE